MRLVFVLSALAALAPAAAQSPKGPTPPSRPPTAPPPAPSPGAPVPGLPPPPAAAPETRPQTGAMMPAPHQARSPDQVFIADALRAGQNEAVEPRPHGPRRAELQGPQAVDDGELHRAILALASPRRRGRRPTSGAAAERRARRR